MDTSRRAAFFDVDGTLTTVTTMFRFLAYRLAAIGEPPHVYQDHRRRLKAMTAVGVSRYETNRAYFACYAGADERETARIAEDWFRAELAAGGFYHRKVLSALQAHRKLGEVIVLVSGSFPACLTPVARHLGADAVLCSEPEIQSGRYTGRIEQPMIGETKADAVRQFATDHGIDLSDATSYGDHESDLPLLRTTGFSTVVGADPVLRHWAHLNGWRSLPGTDAPPPPLPTHTQPTVNS